MNKLMIFEDKPVEVFEFNGQVLFNPKHVAECLDIKNVNDNISKMTDKQVIKLTNSIIGKADFRNSDIGKADIRKLNNAGENFLTESGVFKLIFKSHKAEAEKFQDWVFDEVLPSIRKTGSYQAIPNEVKKEDLIELIKSLPNDNCKNIATIKLLNLIEPVPDTLTQMPLELSDEYVKGILIEFLNDGRGILKHNYTGIVLNKEMLYEHFARYGIRKNQVLKAIRNMDMIPETYKGTTPTVKLDRRTIRAVIIKEFDNWLFNSQDKR